MPKAPTDGILFDLLTPTSGPAVAPGGTYQVRLWLTNLSRGAATQVSVPLSVTGGGTIVTGVPAGGAGSFSGSTWTLGRVEGGAEASLRVTVRAPAAGGLKRSVIRATVRATSTDPSAGKDTAAMSLLSSSPPARSSGPKSGVCAAGEPHDAVAPLVVLNQSGRPAWTAPVARWFNAPVLRVTSQWTDICLDAQGRLLPESFAPDNFTIVAAPESGWTVVDTDGSGPTCNRGATVWRCFRTVDLEPPDNYDWNASINIGTEANRSTARQGGWAGAEVDAEYSARLNRVTVPITFVVRANGCAWATGTGDSAFSCR